MSFAVVSVVSVVFVVFAVLAVLALFAPFALFAIISQKNPPSGEYYDVQPEGDYLLR